MYDPNGQMQTVPREGKGPKRAEERWKGQKGGEKLEKGVERVNESK